ncbi:post-GPI attachment to proteins factor 2-like isoform X1 [Varroa destructor]|uniref:CWH43-like N-terminal domain-containing protein n=2 Tax=Varroa destructor TaxID=109461 RepID=A0A7M7M7Y6_VARDE|nr:post-GPI attachment to proteins factor 2-like isoform X1 [Varroa destructor]
MFGDDVKSRPQGVLQNAGQQQDDVQNTRATEDVVLSESVVLSGGSESRPFILGVSLRRFAYMTACFPLCTLSVCFLYSVAFSYSIVNTTICKVFNVLPSLSAVTGVYPQCQLWRMAVALYFGPQIFLASMLPSYYKRKQLEHASSLTRWAYSKVVMLSAVSHILECLCLIGVAFISSKESFRMHVLLFCSFTTFYLAHLISTCWIVTRFPPTTAEQDSSRRYKLRLAVASGACAFVMTISFYLHRTRCVVMAFSVFSLAEYVFGLSNILFHLTIIYDLPEVQINIAFPGLRSLSSTVSSAVASTSLVQQQTPVMIPAIALSEGDLVSSVGSDTRQASSGSITYIGNVEIRQYSTRVSESAGQTGIESEESTEQWIHKRRLFSFTDNEMRENKEHA